MRLDQYARRHHSQFGEEGMIEYVFSVLRPAALPRTLVSVDIGAGDGISLSNTKWVSRTRLLLEQDREQAAAAERLCAADRVRCVTVTPENINVLIQEAALPQIDLLSLDVDGAEYVLLEALLWTPTLIIVEFNCSVPATVDARQATPKGRFGASALSLKRLGEAKGYTVIGASFTNLFLLKDPQAQIFTALETDLSVLLANRPLPIVASDYDGHPVIVSAAGFHWGLTETFGAHPVVTP